MELVNIIIVFKD